MDNEKNPVQSAGRIFQIMETLAEEGPCGLLELSHLLNLNKTTVHRLLNSLIYMGYVSQDEESLKYHMTLKIVNVSGKVLKQIDVLSMTQPYLKYLMEQTLETVHLVKRVDCDICYIHKLEPANTGRSIQMASFVGMISPLYCTAVGKAIMSRLSEAEVREIWERSDVSPKTEFTILDIEQLLKELEEVRMRGYALDNEENELGVRCVAISINDYTGKAEYAISISAPTPRMSDERILELSSLLLEAGQSLSRELGYHA
ncbi:MAG: IclR family transcriptional regulator [Lachnospiraceae bacterium]|nr:IclR family transcriptional regulator [Lachnospiraceae bacterium]